MARRTQLTNERWLTLQQAADWLGVHPVTLRRWADSGQIACRLTAGGHRRFAQSELERFAQAHLKAPRNPSLPMVWAEAALQQARARDPQSEAQWLLTLDAERREQHRQIGQRLVGLTLQYLSAENGEQLLEEARKLGEDYANASRAAGLSLSDALQAAIYFRDRMLEASLSLSERAQVSPGDNARLIKRLNTLLNVVQLAVVERYQHPE